MGRSLRDGERQVLQPMARRPLEAAGAAVRAFVREVEQPGSAAGGTLDAALAALRQRNAEALEPLQGWAGGAGLRDAAALVSDLGRLEQDVKKAATALRPRHGGPQAGPA